MHARHTFNGIFWCHGRNHLMKRLFTTVSEQLRQLFLFPHFMATSWKKIHGIMFNYLGKRKVVQCNGVLVSFKCSRLTQCYYLDNFLLWRSFIDCFRTSCLRSFGFIKRWVNAYYIYLRPQTEHVLTVELLGLFHREIETFWMECNPDVVVPQMCYLKRWSFGYLTQSLPS